MINILSTQTIFYYILKISNIIIICFSVNLIIFNQVSDKNNIFIKLINKIIFLLILWAVNSFKYYKYLINVNICFKDRFWFYYIL